MADGASSTTVTFVPASLVSGQTDSAPTSRLNTLSSDWPSFNGCVDILVDSACKAPRLSAFQDQIKFVCRLLHPAVAPSTIPGLLLDRRS